MRILHVSTRLILGGSQENTVLSCEGQSRLGHDVHLAFGPIYGPEGSLLDRVERFRTPDGRRVATHVVPDLVRQVDPVRDRRGLRQLAELIRRLEPDIVHTHSSKAGVLGRAAAWRVLRRHAHPIGIVHTVHGPPFMPVEGAPIHRAKVLASNTLYTLAERWAARRCHVIVSVADAMTRQFLERGIGRPPQYVTVYSGMEVERYLEPGAGETRAAARAELALRDDAFVIGTVARLAEHKGHDDILDALAPQLRSSANWRLLWVGDGWWRPRLEARLEREGVRERVLIPGLVPSERVPTLMRAMDVLVHPSYREGLPRTVPQALLCGTPVVAYDTDGTREACIDGVEDPQRGTGRLVPVGDRDGLREAVLWMHEHPHERKVLTQRGRELCRGRFAAQTMVHELEKVYARTLDAAGSVRGGAGPAGGRRAGPGARPAPDLTRG